MRRQDKFRQLVETKLRELRLPRKSLAAVLGVSPSAITRKMNGENPFTDEEVRKLSDFLHMPDVFAYPTRGSDAHQAYDSYDPGIKVLKDAMTQLDPRDKSEIYFVLALLLELKLPRSTFGPILRALAANN